MTRATGEQPLVQQLQELDPTLRFDDLQRHLLGDLTAEQADRIVDHYRRFMVFIGDAPGGVSLVEARDTRRTIYALVLVSQVAGQDRCLSDGIRYAVERYADSERTAARAFFSEESAAVPEDLQAVLGMAVRIQLCTHMLSFLESGNTPGEVA